MDILLLLLRIGLAGVMGLAGFAKLADLSGSRQAFEGFGLKGPLAKFGPIALSLIEIVIAAALLFTEFSWYGAIAALTLLVVFIAQMAYQLAKGNSPDCHCFGQVYSAPVSAMSVVRNVVFAIPALVLVVRGQLGQGASITDPNVNTLELIFAVIVTAFLLGISAYLRKILQRQDQILKELEIMDIVAKDGGTVERNEAGPPREGLPIGALVPELALKDLDGRGVSLADLNAGGLPVLFMFVSPNCTPCRSMIPDFEKWTEDLSGRVRVAFITSGTADENIQKFGKTIASSLYLQDGREVATMLRATWTPSAVFIDRNGRIASQIAAGDQAIRTLVESIENEDLSREDVFFTSGTPGASRAPVGEPVPEFSLSDSKGNEITSAYLKGKRTLITFWHPDCGFCKAMAEDLRTWDSSRGPGDPDLIVLTPEEDSLVLDSPILIDPDSKTATKLGMQGTPSAILVNEKGIVASETAIGAPDIWSLIGKRK